MRINARRLAPNTHYEVVGNAYFSSSCTSVPIAEFITDASGAAVANGSFLFPSGSTLAEIIIYPDGFGPGGIFFYGGRISA